MKSVNEKDTVHANQDILGGALYDEIIRDDFYQLKQFYRSSHYTVASVIDIGANIGFFSLLAAVLYPQANMLLLEPNMLNVELISENFTNFKNIYVVQKALGNGKPVEIVNDRRWSGSDMFKESEEGNVESISFSDLVNGNWDLASNNYILKVDCEGGEYWLTKEPKEMFDNCVYFIAEFHENAAGGLNTLENWNKWFHETFEEIRYYKLVQQKGIDSATGIKLSAYFAVKR